MTMEVDYNLQRFKYSAIFKVIFTIYCLTLLQLTGYMLEAKSNNNSDDDEDDNNVCDNCCSANIMLPMTNSTGTGVQCSFTEEYVDRRAGRHVDLKSLITKYASICPIKHTCGVGLNQSLVYPHGLFPYITGKL